MSLDEEIVDLNRKLQGDAGFRERYERDPVETASQSGFAGAADALSHVQRAARKLRDRLARDATFRDEVERSPAETLAAAGLPESAVEPFLRANGLAPDVQGFRYPDPHAGGWLEPLFERPGPRNPRPRSADEI